MSERFAWHRPNGDRIEGGFVAARLAARERIVGGKGPFDLTKDGKAVLTGASRNDVLRALLTRLDRGDVGPVYRVFGRGGLAFQVREIKAAPDVINTSGNDKADLYWSTIVDEFGEYMPRFAGAYVCKSILGSSTPSQHSYGNAVDVFFDTLAHQERVADWVVAHADELGVEHVISGSRIWTRGVGWHAYTGEFHRHLHVDFDPPQSGKCGVKP